MSLMTHTRLANLLIDTVDRFASAATEADRWQAMLDTGARIGANSVTCTGFLGDTGKMLWSQCSMAPEWVEEYMASTLSTSDPIVAALFRRQRPTVVQSGNARRTKTSDPKLAQLFAGHARHGCNYFTSHLCRDAEQTRTIHFSTTRDPTHLFGPGTFVALQSIAAIVATNCRAPDTDSPATIYGARYRNLTALERDVLCLMGHGHHETTIADRLGLPENMVRLARATAGQKMGATGGEQTLAIALSRGLLDL
jgi:DNA-binding CsgD family transcriptional regulator